MEYPLWRREKNRLRTHRGCRVCISEAIDWSIVVSGGGAWGSTVGLRLSQIPCSPGSPIAPEADAFRRKSSLAFGCGKLQGRVSA